MGTDCAPLLANLFLFFYEYEYVKDKLKHNPNQALLFKHTVRYIDDLLTLNNPMFESEITNIYPHQLQLKKTTESIDMLSYLDVCIKIKNKAFCTSVYDKRDNFNFFVVKFPYLDGNIPAKPAYGIYVSQLVRIGRICDNYKDFLKKHKELTSRLVKQGFRYDKLCSSFKKFYKKYKCIVDKLGYNVRKHIKDGITLPITRVRRIHRFVGFRH